MTFFFCYIFCYMNLFCKSHLSILSTSMTFALISSHCFSLFYINYIHLLFTNFYVMEDKEVIFLTSVKLLVFCRLHLGNIFSFFCCQRMLRYTACNWFFCFIVFQFSKTCFAFQMSWFLKLVFLSKKATPSKAAEN